VINKITELKITNVDSTLDQCFVLTIRTRLISQSNKTCIWNHELRGVYSKSVQHWMVLFRVRSKCDVQCVSRAYPPVTRRHYVVSSQSGSDVGKRCQYVHLCCFSSDTRWLCWSSDCALHAASQCFRTRPCSRSAVRCGLRTTCISLSLKTVVGREPDRFS